MNQTPLLLHNRAATGVCFKCALLAIALLAFAFMAPHAEAQSFIRFKAGQLRVTVPPNSGTTTVISNNVTIGGFTSGTGPSLSVTGLPPGATATLSSNPIVANGPLFLTVNATNVAEGVYTFSLNGSGTDSNALPVANNILFTLQVAYIWNGGNNVAVNGAGSLGTGVNWVGGVAPGPLDDLIFGDLGSQTNFLINSNLTPNIIISANTTNASARFSQTNSTNRVFVIQLTNATWAFLGTNGFSLLRDYVDNIVPISATMTNIIYGGGRVIVSNELANFSLLIDNAVQNLLDMSQLDNFAMDVNQISLGDYYQYPNFFNLETNNYLGVPRQFFANWNMARTNVIRAVYADPFNYTNSDRREYGLSFMNSELSGSGTAPVLNLGISNSFLLDGVNFIGGNSRGTVQFNPNLRITTNIVGGVTNLTTNTMAAYFRGTNGGRMSMFCVADGGGTNTANSNIKTTVDFSTSGGILNVLADRFIIGRDRQLIASNGNPNYQGFMNMGNGLMDVNTAIFGFREHYQTNTTPPTVGTLPSFSGYCEGKFTIVSNGTLKVNQVLTLGSTVANLAVQLGLGGNTEYGEVIVQNNSTLIANQINVGGPVYGSSRNNFIIVSNSSSLVLSNTLAGPQQSLDTLIFNNSTLTMNLDGTNTTPYIYTTNLTTTGTNAIVISSIKHLGSITAPVQLVQFSAGGGSFQTLVMPSGLGGALLTTPNVGIFLTILTNSPKNIVWRGYNSADWDFTTANWQDLSNGNPTNFANGDNVFFDDNATVPTTIHLGGNVDIIPGSIGMTNNLNYYTIDNASGGDIQGSATFNKSGTNGLEIDGFTTVSVNVNQGYLTGNSSGNVGSVNIAAGASMNFGGGVNNGFTTASLSTTYSGTGAGVVTILTNGGFTNTGTISGGFSIAPGSIYYNLGHIGTSTSASYNAVGNPVIVSNATLINSGDIHTLTLTVNGTFEDTGAGTLYINGDVPSGTRGITIALGGTFIPGGDGIGTTTITHDQPDANAVPGRLLLSTGSTNVFKVNLDSGINNTLVNTLFLGLGPNENTPAVNGGTLLIQNVGVAAFSAGQVFALFQNSSGGGDPFNAGLNTTNAYPKIIPASPGPGLAWDLSGIIQHGTLGVIGVNTNSTAVTFHSSFVPIVSTNSSGTPTGTNFGSVLDLHWPADHIGWELQSQSTLTNFVSTNWVTVAGSTFTNDVLITNVIGTNAAATYYRIIYP